MRRPHKGFFDLLEKSLQATYDTEAIRPVSVLVVRIGYVVNHFMTG